MPMAPTVMVLVEHAVNVPAIAVVSVAPAVNAMEFFKKVRLDFAII
jgi:hypothetical protein